MLATTYCSSSFSQHGGRSFSIKPARARESAARVSTKHTMRHAIKSPNAPDGGRLRGGAVAGGVAAAADGLDGSFDLVRPPWRHAYAQEASRAAGSIDMHTAQEEVASTTQHHSVIIILHLGAARCTVADRVINAPVAQPYLFIGPCRPVLPSL